MDALRLMPLVFASACFAATVRAEPTPSEGPDCASVSAAVRIQAYGYAHVVTLANGCQRAVTCEVWTNVDPSPHYTLLAKPGQSAEVVTRNGSPAREVQALRQCRYTLM